MYYHKKKIGMHITACISRNDIDHYPRVVIKQLASNRKGK